MAGWPRWLNEYKQRITIAIVPNLADVLDVARGAAFVPQRLAAAAPKVGLARLLCQAQRLGVHPGDHEHVAAVAVLHNGRYQPLLIKFNHQEHVKTASICQIDAVSLL